MNDKKMMAAGWGRDEKYILIKYNYTSEYKISNDSISQTNISEVPLLFAIFFKT